MPINTDKLNNGSAGKGFGQHVGQRSAQESRKPSGNSLELRGQVTAGLANTAQAQAIEMSKTIQAARAFNRKNAGLLAKEIKAIASGEDFTIQLMEALQGGCERSCHQGQLEKSQRQKCQI